MYAAIWFWLATVLTIAMLHIFNSLELPVSSMWKSYSIVRRRSTTRTSSGGTATTRSGFLLTTPILGLMYYFLPKQAGRPIYSHQVCRSCTSGR